jgi:hypothetical protein
MIARRTRVRGTTAKASSKLYRLLVAMIQELAAAIASGSSRWCELCRFGLPAVSSQIVMAWR